MANKFIGEATAEVEGVTWTLRCDFNAMAAFETATGKDAMEAFGEAEENKVSIPELIQMVHSFLQRHHPDATLQDAGDVLSHDLSVVQRVISACMPSSEEAAGLGNGRAAVTKAA